eukprot:Protomagalhaensia_sp_Gyna_25__1192@NODE_1590_length_1708_cov_9_200719_g1296_i0_p2_GENE_NODE_1590_length_1708_cov_9_200719_g1296_i0NODE_1590_length_1708_cov_9_200719_g1296_i0_p2_ORF_typecomplete_len106_score14_29Rad10/PF03834_14/1_2e21_NODE_1590_length_1708_cov_9_200719_g1296_i0219536
MPELTASHRQKQSPLLPYMKQVPVRFSESVLADFVTSQDIGILFIALSFQRLHQDHYLPVRLNECKNSYRIRVLLCLIDVEDADKLLLEVTALAYRSESVSRRAG